MLDPRSALEPAGFRFAELVTGRDDRDPRRPRAEHGTVPGGRQQRQLGRAEPGPSGTSTTPSATSSRSAVSSSPGHRLGKPGLPGAHIGPFHRHHLSAPDGSSAPVMIRTQVPGATVTTRVSPAGTWSVTGRVTGAPLVAAAMSEACTAYPSIEELSKDGNADVATASVASTAPWASSSPSRTGSIGRIAASTRARWASTGSMSVMAGRPGISGATAGTRRPRPAVPARTGRSCAGSRPGCRCRNAGRGTGRRTPRRPHCPASGPAS